ncbi:hypothetical protein CLV53_11298 [Sediminibacterium magnilacihabitans]|jgi:hypothetical protein|nr:hypothetical protein CLV53_11298 [Sediminibacterium magnilacihabitans]
MSCWKQFQNDSITKQIPFATTSHLNVILYQVCDVIEEAFLLKNR